MPPRLETESFRQGVTTIAAIGAGLVAGWYGTQRRQLLAERSWRLSDGHVDLTTDSSGDGCMITLDPAGSVSAWNPAAEGLYGYRPRDMIGQHVLRLYSAEDAKQGRPQKDLLIAARDSQLRTEGWRRRKDGSCFRAEVHITALYGPATVVRGYIKQTREVTALRHTEEQPGPRTADPTGTPEERNVLPTGTQGHAATAASEMLGGKHGLQRERMDSQSTRSLLLASDARYRNILHSAMDAIITVDESQHVVLFNEAAVRVFGCQQDEAIGEPLDQFIPERFRSGHADHIRQFSRSPVGSRRMGAHRLVTGRRVNGEEFPIEASISHVQEGDKSFFTVILRDVTASVRDREALRQASDKMHELALLACKAREQERRRVARELHDDVAQDLAALSIDMDHVKRDVQGNVPLRLDLERMQTSVTRAIVSTRRIAADLRPLILDDLGLDPAIEWLAENFAQRTGVPCAISVELPQPGVGEPHASAVFRILQESLANTAKHAHASKVEAFIHFRDGFILVDVADNGNGFNPDDPHGPDSMGLAGLRERARLLGGEATVESSPGNGTRVHARIPYTASIAA